MTESKIVEYTPSQALATEFPEFSKITVYGTQENPLFPVRQVQQLLGVAQIRLDKGGFNLGEDYIKVTCVGRDGTHEYEQNLLTEDGLNRILFKYETPVCKKFRRFTKVVMRELRLRGEVNLETAIGKLKEYEEQLAERDRIIAERDRTIAERDRQLTEKDHQLEEKHGKLIQSDREKDRFYLQKMAAVERAGAAEMQLRLRDERKDESYIKDKLKEMYMKRVYVYFAKPPKIIEEEFVDLDGLDPDDDDEICFEVSYREREQDACATMHVHKKIQMEELRTHLHGRDFTLMVGDKMHPKFFRGTIQQLQDAVDALL